LIALALPIPASEAMAVFTFVVNAASLPVSMVERFVSLPAHAESASTAAAITTPKNLDKLIMHLSLWK
jgi:hypothetical protein